MTLGDVIVVLICLAIGYWLVARILPGPDAPRPTDTAKDVDAAQPPGPPTYEPVTLSNWHRILEVNENASREEINAAYRRKISQYHPDKVAQMGEDIRAVADAKSQQINAAYEIGMRR